jgi:hypothetical protein
MVVLKIICHISKTSAQRSERLKVEEKILVRPERTRRSREDRERIFDDGFESHSSCAEVFQWEWQRNRTDATGIDRAQQTLIDNARCVTESVFCGEAARDTRDRC